MPLISLGDIISIIRLTLNILGQSDVDTLCDVTHRTIISAFECL